MLYNYGGFFVYTAINIQFFIELMPMLYKVLILKIIFKTASFS